jgi:hypothetical protein
MGADKALMSGYRLQAWIFDVDASEGESVTHHSSSSLSLLPCCSTSPCVGHPALCPDDFFSNRKMLQEYYALDRMLDHEVEKKAQRDVLLCSS